jgi:hypothetical protein
MSDPNPLDQDLDDELDVDPGPQTDEDPAATLGQLVKVTHFDTANMVDIVQYGTVVDVLDEGVVVGLFPQVVGPLPLDHTCHERIDAPRVEILADDDTASVDELVRALTGA